LEVNKDSKSVVGWHEVRLDVVVQGQEGNRIIIEAKI